MADAAGASPGLVALAEAHAANTLSTKQYAACKEAFDSVAHALSACKARIEELQAAHRDLDININSEVLAVERARFRKDEVERAVVVAEQERLSAVAVLRNVEAKDSAVQAEINELKLRESELQSDVAQLRKDNDAMVIPALQGLADAVAEAKAETARCESQLEQLGEQKADLRAKVEDVRNAGRASAAVVTRLRTELSRAEGEPPRLMRALEIVREALGEAVKDKDKLSAALAARDKEMVTQSASLHEVQAMRKTLDQKLHRHRGEVEACTMDVGELEKSVRAERQQRKELLEKKVELVAEDDAARNSVRLASATADSAAAGYERAKRELKRVQDKVVETERATGPIRSQLADKELLTKALDGEAAQLGREEAMVRKSMDVSVAKYLKEEAVEKKQREALAELVAESAALDDEKEQWKREEELAEKQLAALSTQQDMKSRELAKTVAARKATIEASRMKELLLLDLTKQLADLQGKMKTSSQLYEAVKSERNNMSAAIARVKQSVAEMHERLKILDNEADILGGEAESKEKALAKERQAAAATSAQRDVLRAEVNKAVNLYRSKQHAVEGRILSIDKLSGNIASLEREMLGMKRAYEGAVEMRNYTGIQLIDRNDELCVLYEKSNIQERTLEGGEAALRAVAEEIRGLNLTIADIARSMTVAKNKAPEAPKWAEKVLQLQQDVAQAKRLTERLSARLESPSEGKGESWQELGGEDPGMEELAAREADLTARLDTARDALLTRDMALEETGMLIDRLRAEVAGAPGQGGAGGAGGAAVDSQAALARTVNDLQGKLREATRRIMALVSELSTYQSTAARLQAEIRAGEEALDKANSALAVGLAPSAAAETRFANTERLLRAATAAPAGGEEGKGHHVEGRPNSYVAEGAGGVGGEMRPYGTFAPFKPTEPGASQRFFRQPQPTGAPMGAGL